VASLGARCTLVGIVGGDKEGECLQSVLDAKDIHSRLAVDEAGKTVTKLRIVSQNQQLIRADFDDGPEDSALNRSLELYREALEEADVVVLSDYGKGSLSRVSDMIESASARSIPVLVDPKSADFSRYAGATIVTPNFSEFEAVVGPVRDDEELKSQAVDLVRDLGIHGLLITRGEKGMVLVEKEAQWFDYPASAKEVFDVSGAGDTVMAAFAVGYALKLPDDAVVRLANAAAGIVVGKVGTAAVTVDEVLGILESQKGRRGKL
jgi:D-beta-D-heptose 7-phosphate kinase/D-beta-D-heptose 1-phosphate adenosyltransferase